MLKDLVYDNESEVKRRIISELQSVSATEFEQFCISFLGPLGYEQLQVTGRGADRGIDSHGLFRQGVVTIRSAFQAKRGFASCFLPAHDARKFQPRRATPSIRLQP